MSLRGEWWLSSEGDEIFADSDADIEVLSHELAAMREFIYQIEESIIDEIYENQEHWESECGQGLFDKLEHLFDESDRWGIIVEYEPCLKPLLRNLWGEEKAKDIFKDPRTAFEKYENQIRVKYYGEQANYEAYGWTSRKLMVCQNHLMEQLEGLSEKDKLEDLKRITVYVEDTKTNKFNHYSALEFLELKAAGRMFVVKNPRKRSN